MWRCVCARRDVDKRRRLRDAERQRLRDGWSGVVLQAAPEPNTDYGYSADAFYDPNGGGNAGAWGDQSAAGAGGDGPSFAALMHGVDASQQALVAYPAVDGYDASAWDGSGTWGAAGDGSYNAVGSYNADGSYSAEGGYAGYDASAGYYSQGEVGAAGYDAYGQALVATGYDAYGQPVAGGYDGYGGGADGASGGYDAAAYAAYYAQYGTQGTADTTAEGWGEAGTAGTDGAVVPYDYSQYGSEWNGYAQAAEDAGGGYGADGGTSADLAAQWAAYYASQAAQ
jgi:hypothetical protein